MIVHRLALAALAICACASHAPHAVLTAKPPAISSAPRFDYPTTKRDDVIDELHGTKVRDPYRWLEGDGADVTAWMEAQDGRARGRIAELSDVSSRWEEILRLWKPIAAPVETSRGARSFFLAAGKLMVRERGADRAIFDAASLPERTRITDFVPSIDGARVAVELSRSGADMRTLRVLDVAKPSAPLDELDGIEDANIVWTTGGFFYAFTPTNVDHATRWRLRDIRFHRPGHPRDEDRIVVPASNDPDASSGMNPIAITDDGRRLLVRTFGNWSRRTYAIVDLASPKWDVHVLGEAASACVVGASIFASTLAGDGTSEIFRVRDAQKPWDSVGHADAHFLGMKSLGSFLLVRHARGASVENQFYDGDFRLLATRRTEPGITESYAAAADTVAITREGLRRPPERLSFDPRSGREASIATSPVLDGFDPNAFSVEVAEAVSKDRTPVPITVLRRKDVALDGRAPLWVYGYGGFRNSAEQIFFAPWVSWSMRGGVFAICHARGGLEWGEGWHQGGARRNRQNTLDDFAACLGELHRRGYSSPGRTMTQGWSHGGMVVSAVAMQHPELQRVVLATVPLTDMVRFARFGRGGVSEYGDPDDPGDFATLAAISPYHHVGDGVRYPAFFITASTNDERAAPMHARKLAAALQHASAGGEVLLEVNWGAGHHGGGKQDANRVFAEAASFAMHAFDAR